MAVRFEMERGNMEVIYAYTRAQAIADGVLVDVSEMGKEAGFRHPVALTDTVFNSYVRVPEGVDCQDEKGRLWDILWMLHVAIKRGANSKDRDGANLLLFELCVRNDNESAKMVQLKAICGPGDDAEPVITIMEVFDD